MCVTTGADNLETEEEIEAPLAPLDTNNGMSVNSPRDGNSSSLSSVDDEEDEGRGRGNSSDGSKNKIKMMCSYGGCILPRRDGQLGYVGGETRILVVNKEVRFSSLIDKLARMVGKPKKAFVLKYQLPNEDLDALVSVSSDEDVVNMMDEYYKAVVSKSATEPKLRAFIFFIASPTDSSSPSKNPSSSAIKSSPQRDASQLHRFRPFNDARCQLRWYLEHHQRFTVRQHYDPVDPAQSCSTTPGADYYTQQQDSGVSKNQACLRKLHYEPLQHPLSKAGYYYSRHHHLQEEGRISTDYYDHAYSQHEHKHIADSPPPSYHHCCRC